MHRRHKRRVGQATGSDTPIMVHCMCVCRVRSSYPARMRPTVAHCLPNALEYSSRATRACHALRRRCISSSHVPANARKLLPWHAQPTIISFHAGSPVIGKVVTKQLSQAGGVAHGAAHGARRDTGGKCRSEARPPLHTGKGKERWRRGPAQVRGGGSSSACRARRSRGGSHGTQANARGAAIVLGNETKGAR